MGSSLSRDFVAGLVAMAIGAFVLFEGSGYALGTARRMGPGFFPVALGGLLLLVGLAITLAGLRTHDRLPKPNPRALVAIPLALVVFALLVERVGFFPAGVAAVLVASAADGGSRPLTALVLALVLVPLAYGLFVLLLGVPIAFVEWRP
ncbi:tripartite tricarboxylate transporter TctB family protein [Salinarimonas ramus]|uniref:DUF1468 domain-containing protein n=1 Tax=Salinarimonas ramus TaxID=690164 RepID=A0A917Q3Y6_9HYPH|nr:tripartite tricarboxylate transporter TctB family protein [Salinarimonas ramus]GGK20448.1 hypothetical protein GCM10011322_03890 [Salinarimonas ramus]